MKSLGELDEFRRKVGQHDADIEELKRRLTASAAAAELDDETEEPDEDDAGDEDEDEI